MSETMKYVYTVLIASILGINSAWAGEGHHHFSGDPIKAMADIIIGIKHFPNKAERAQLKDIMSHTNDSNIKTIAAAMVNMRHSVKNEDKEKLISIVNDKNADANARLLAKILYDFSHKPGREDKQKLTEISAK